MAEYQVIATEENHRVDKYIADQLKFITRSKVQSLIKEELITLLPAHKTLSASQQTKLGEEYHIIIPENMTSPNFAEVLDVVYEDDYLAVINKPAGLTVHGGIGTKNDTLVDILLQVYGHQNLSNKVMRPGIVHRLDKNTSGLMVIAKNDIVHAHLAAAITSRQLKRQYIAIVCGTLKETAGIINANIAPYPKDKRRMHIVHNTGKHAITHYKVLEILSNKDSMVECTLETGRTHQIRLHMSHIGHPIVGDTVYGSPSEMISRQALHAYKMTFQHPITSCEIALTSQIPEDIKHVFSGYDRQEVLHIIL